MKRASQQSNLISVRAPFFTRHPVRYGFVVDLNQINFQMGKGIV
jgi:hypothetical protein